MGKINILSQDLINQIAAGEVVERPASVVKELVENAIDAGANDITIEIENGGLSLIKVIDNGCGMDRQDAEKSILQHATSKLVSIDDLHKISSMGFRGEALASIASVSQFRLVTKDEQSLAGTEVLVDNNITKINDIGCATGTSVEIRDLFINIPARRKYLKTSVTEFNHVVDLFLNYSLIYPDYNLKLMHNGKPVYNFPATYWEQRLADVLGEELISELLPLDMKLNEIHIKGFIGKPQVSRNNRKLQYLYINKRPVNEFIVAKRIKDAYTTLIPKDLYPVYILDLNVNTEKVDVNVHPRKLEVRFSDPQSIYSSVYSAVTRLLDEHDLVKSVGVGELKRFIPVGDVIDSKRQISIPVKNISYQNLKQQIPIKNNDSFSFKKSQDNVSDYVGMKQNFEKKSFVPNIQDNKDYKILAQVQNSYIIVETEKGIKIYDQHASSERVQYEKIKNQWRIGKLASQQMLIPQNLELTPIEGRIIVDNKNLFERLGFDISEFGGNSFIVSAIPQWFVNKDIKQIILDLVGNMDENILVGDQISEPIDKMLKMMSCRSAIKFGDALSYEGMEALIDDLEKLDNQYTCVHGRPCVIEFSFFDLEKMFKRRN